MLTKEVINTIKSVDLINERVAQLCHAREGLLEDIKNLILEEDFLCGLDQLEIISLSITDAPIGRQQENGSYTFEKCDDSLFMPDSGHGLVCWPIEGGKWLKIDYIW